MLFLAGVTSSISIGQPTIAFLKNEFSISRGKAVIILSVIMFIFAQPAIWFFKYGVLDDLDFWAANFVIVLGALIEMILFGWVLGAKKGWEALHMGANITVPRIFRFIIKYVTPLFLLTILGFWFYQEWIPTIMMEGVASQDMPYILGTRLGLVFILLALCVLVYFAWRKRRITAKGDI